MFQSSVVKHFQSLILESVWVIFCVLGASAIILSIIAIPIYATGNGAFFETALGTLSLYAGQYVAALAVLLLVPFIRVKHSWSKLWMQLGFTRKPSLTDPFIALGAWVGYFLASFAVISLVALVLPGINLEEAQEIGFKTSDLQLYEYILAFIALAVLPPLAEETIFRGYLFGRLRQKYTFWFSAIVTSIVFGIVHLQINVGIDVFVLSLFLCYLRQKTGSLWAPIFLHAIKNSVAYIFLFALK